MEPLKLKAEDGVTGDKTSGGNVVIDNSELVFTATFTLECIIKVLAMGFVIAPMSYLRDENGWTAVVVSLLSNIPGMDPTFATLSEIPSPASAHALLLPGMRALIGTLINSVPLIANVMLFCVFFYTIFGIFGYRFSSAYMTCASRLSRTPRCDHSNNPLVERCREVIPALGLITTSPRRCCCRMTPRRCARTRRCIEWALVLQGMMCLDHANPNYGITHYDNIASACLTIFQCITLEGGRPLYQYMDALTGWAVVYFVLLVFTGGFSSSTWRSVINEV